MKVKAGGFDINVESSGEGPAVLLLHGFLGSCEAWGKLEPALASRFTCLRMDLLGHGKSDAPRNAAAYTMPEQLKRIESVIDALGLKTLSLMGYSMGGRLALAFAIRRPDVVTALVLEGASAGIEPQDERAARRGADDRWARMIEQDGMEAFVSSWESLPLFKTLDRLEEAEQERLRTVRLSTSPIGAAMTVRSMSPGRCSVYWADLPTMKAPTFIVAGQDDAKYVGLARRLADLLPDSKMAVIAGAGHNVHLEQPEEFDDLVMEFLLKRTARRSGETEADRVRG